MAGGTPGGFADGATKPGRSAGEAEISRAPWMACFPVLGKDVGLSENVGLIFPMK